jgi:acetolactate synthase I/III small subunit
VDVHREALIFEVTGDEGKMDAFIEQMRGFGILELNRTGRVALTRSAAEAKAKGKGDTKRLALSH